MFSRVFKYKGCLSKLSIAFHGCIRLELDLGIILPLMYSLLTVSKSGIALRSKVMYSSGVKGPFVPLSLPRFPSKNFYNSIKRQLRVKVKIS